MPAPVRLTPPLPTIRLAKAAVLARLITPLLVTVPPTWNAELLPTAIVPALAPVPVPVVALNVPAVIDRVAVAAVWMLLTVSLVEAVTV